ncbi:Uncharacterised protein [Mycobacteroides abscessus subsp. abscessus]|nr:Uncharacterised protein [Mycobacteroides abscessus subsp. abscessus]
MSDRDVTDHRAERLLVEDLTDQTEVLEDKDLRTVADRDARGFLAAVLQCVQAVVAEFGDVFAGCPDTKNAALLARLVLGFVHCVPCGTGMLGRSQQVGACDRKIRHTTGSLG